MDVRIMRVWRQPVKCCEGACKLSTMALLSYYDQISGSRNVIVTAQW